MENPEIQSITERWRRWRPVYGALFIGFSGLAVFYRIWRETVILGTDDSIAKVFHAVWSDLERTGGKATFLTVLTVEVMAIMMGTGDAIVRWAERRAEKADAKAAERGYKRGMEQGMEQGMSAGREAERQWEAWYGRMQDAQQRGEPFDEPPPRSEG